MSFARKIRRKVEKKRIKGEARFQGKDDFTDKIIEFLESSPESVKFFTKAMRESMAATGRLMGPMDVCVPIVHVENQEWLRFFGIEAGQERLYAMDGYLSGAAVLTENIHSEVFFVREQIASELALGRRAMPGRQGTAVVFHKDGTAEFFYFLLPTNSPRASSAEDMQHGDDTSVNFG